MVMQFSSLLWAIPLCALCAVAVAADTGEQRKGDKVLVYLGTYTGGGSEGIYVCTLDTATGEVSEPKLAAKLENASYLTVHPSKKYLYAVSEVDNFQGKPTGSVVAYRIDAKSGELTKINEEAAGGTITCFVAIDPTGKTAMVANYGSGSIASLPLADDGSLKPAASVIQHEGTGGNPQRQGEPHAHSINTDPTGKFVLSADLGIDKVLLYRLDATKGTLTENDPPFVATHAGAGPRHFAFHPGGETVYVINELDSTVTGYRYDDKAGKLESFQKVSTLPEGFKENNSTAEIVIHPNGKFLYGSNRGHNSIAIFAIDEASGELTLVGNEPTGGKTPRNFNLDPSASFMLVGNQDSGSVTIFRVDGESGKLKPTGGSIKIAQPAVIKFLTLDGR